MAKNDKKSVKNMIFLSKLAEKTKKGVKSRFFKNSMGSEVENQKFYIFLAPQSNLEGPQIVQFFPRHCRNFRGD